MKVNWKSLLITLGIPLAVGGLGTLFSGGMSGYEYLYQPPLAPPGWLFPIVWSILYLLMGYSSYRVLYSGGSFQQIRQALRVYGVQLLLNFLWPIVFFGFQAYWLAFLVLILLWAFIYLTMHLFGNIDEIAENCLIPYLFWVTFAGYLNLGVAILN